jgi:biopolymer transport protein ExbD
MNRLLVCLLLFMFAVMAARAEETNTPTPTRASDTSNAVPTSVTSNGLPVSITIDGTTYEEVRWERVTPTSVTIFHSTDVATIPLKSVHE